MSYEAPYLDQSGLHLPTYNDVLQYLIQNYKNIFGQDVYIENDTQDYQLLSLYAKKWDQVASVVLDTYNARNVNWATGTQLDTIVSLNGLRRLSATYSTVTLKLTGTPQTSMQAGVQARDQQGNTWQTTQDVTFGSLGVAYANAKCTEPGAITAPANTIIYCQTPQYNWTSVTNEQPAVAGRDTQKDAQLRQRRAKSVSKSADSSLDAITGALINLDGVTSARVVQNAENTTDSNGIPPHSICAIVQNGSTADIAQTIYKKRAPGIGTYGNTTAVYKDRWNKNNTIKFSRPTTTQVSIVIGITALSEFDSVDTPNAIKKAVKQYVDGLDIGTPLTVPYIYAQAYSANVGSVPTFVITSVVAKDSSGTSHTSTFNVSFDSKFSSTVTLNIS